MDRHSSYIFIWLQLELCAMAVLLTKGEGPRWGPGGACGDRAGGSTVPGAGPAAVSGPRAERRWWRSRRVCGSHPSVPLVPALSRPLGPGTAVWLRSVGALGALGLCGLWGSGAAAPGGSGLCGLAARRAPSGAEATRWLPVIVVLRGGG